jgi:hypothetical protein
LLNKAITIHSLFITMQRLLLPQLGVDSVIIPNTMSPETKRIEQENVKLRKQLETARFKEENAIMRRQLETQKLIQDNIRLRQELAKKN